MTRAIGIETIGMAKQFGAFTALDDVSIRIGPGGFHALMGENGAGKSTLVKCVMGFHPPTRGTLRVEGKEVAVKNPRDAMRLGIGMVYQHFTLVPSLTGAENLVAARPDCPAVVDWAAEARRLEAFLDRMPFRVPMDRPAGTLAAGERQKLEILKQLYLDLRFLILDEPTSVLTPQEADEILGLLRGMAAAGDLTVLMITHKFREVTAYADTVTVLRRGRHVGGGKVADLSTDEMAAMMVGTAAPPARAERLARPRGEVVLELAGLVAEDDDGLLALDGVNIKVRAGEIVGIAGVSGNGQSELVEVLSGQRPLREGQITVRGEEYEPVRRQMARFKVFGLPEEPLRNAAVPNMSVAENLAFRRFDQAEMAKMGWWLSPGPMRAAARELIGRYRIKTSSAEARIDTLSGGNVQRAVLARELSGDVEVLIVANPCFGLDFASVADIRGQILARRNAGAAVLLVSEDLDEILELADRVLVMLEGQITYEAPAEGAEVAAIGRAMGGHAKA
jgi:simple sugar transport system ATP-binding protein